MRKLFNFDEREKSEEILSLAVCFSTFFVLSFICAVISRFIQLEWDAMDQFFILLGLSFFSIVPLIFFRDNIDHAKFKDTMKLYLCASLLSLMTLVGDLIFEDFNIYTFLSSLIPLLSTSSILIAILIKQRKEEE